MKPDRTINFSISLPCYNEADNLRPILERFKETIHRNDVEVIFVNNGSTDGTKERLSTLLPDFPFARTINVQQNRGYGYGIIQGLRQSSGQYLGWTHADSQADPADAIKAIQTLEEQDNPSRVYVKGLRTGRPATDRIFTIGMSAIETLYLAAPLWDINAQPNLFSRKFFETWINPPHDFSLDLYALFAARSQGLKLLRFPVEFKKREHGESKWNSGFLSRLKMIKRTLAFSAGMKRGFKNGIHSSQDQHGGTTEENPDKLWR